MEVRCDRSELLERLNTIAGIVPANPTKPILDDILLRTQDGHLVAEATDLELSGRVILHKLEVQEEGEVALPCSRLISILKEIPELSVEIRSTEGPIGASLESSGYRFKILGHDPAEFPRVPADDGAPGFSVSRERLLDSLKRVGVGASRDPTRYQLNGVFIEIREGKISFTATDGKRLTHDYFSLSGDGSLELSAIVPNQACDIFSKVLSSGATSDETVHLAISESHISLRAEDSEIRTTLIDGMYPNYRSIFPQERKLRLKGRRLELLTATKGASLTTDKETSTVRFQVTPESLVLESKARDIGESKVEGAVEVNGEPMEMQFNPVYFIDALRCFEEDDVIMDLVHPGKPAVIKGSQNYLHMVMPLVDKV